MMRNCASENLEIPGLRLNGASRNDADNLTETQHGRIAAPMINAATISVVRRRRTSAVRADICV